MGVELERVEGQSFTPKRGYVRPPTKAKKPTKPVRGSADDLIDEVEKMGGAVIPELVMVVVKSYRSLEATNRALKEEMAKHVETIKQLRAKKKP